MGGAPFARARKECDLVAGTKLMKALLFYKWSEEEVQAVHALSDRLDSMCCHNATSTHCSPRLDVDIQVSTHRSSATAMQCKTAMCERRGGALPTVLIRWTVLLGASSCRQPLGDSFWRLGR